MRPSLALCLLALLAGSLLLASVHADDDVSIVPRRNRHHRRHPAHPQLDEGVLQRFSPAAEKEANYTELDALRARRGPDGRVGSYGVDMSQGYDADTFACLVEKGFTFLIQRIWRSVCKVDAAAAASVDAAWRGGMKMVDIYLFPARECEIPPQEQVRQAVEAMDGHDFGTLWSDTGKLRIDVEEEGSHWSPTPSTNLAWLRPAVAQAVSMLGKHRVGIYSDSRSWNKVTGNTTEFGEFPIWYARFDKNATFANFVPFGPWQHPTIKQFADGPPVCGASVDHNWLPW